MKPESKLVAALARAPTLATPTTTALAYLEPTWLLEAKSAHPHTSPATDRQARAGTSSGTHPLGTLPTRSISPFPMPLVHRLKPTARRGLCFFCGRASRVSGSLLIWVVSYWSGDQGSGVIPIHPCRFCSCPTTDAKGVLAQRKP